MKLRKKTIRLESFAKINLALDVLGVMENGYHLVDTIMQSVSLKDNIDLHWTEDKEAQGLDIQIRTNKPYLPTDERNLAYKAAELFNQTAKKRGLLEIEITKTIPVAAGLAGGSGNCAAVLIGLNKLWKMRYNTKALCQIGMQLGADVPFCILAQNTHFNCAFGTGVGDQLRALRKGLDSYLVLAKPAFGVSTKEVFSGIDKCQINERPNIRALKKALKGSNKDEAFKNMHNVLEEYTLKAYPQVAKLKDIMSNTEGARKVLMSGSGPTVIGFYDSYGLAKNACMKIREKGYEAYWSKCNH